MQRVLSRTAVLLGFALVGIQFVPTSTKPNTVTAGEVHMVEMIEPRVGAVLDRSCQDCHSGSTHLPWYGRVAPVSWILSSDINKGRNKLDFSQWMGRAPSTNERMEICDAVSDGSMPLRVYTAVHRNARLSKQDVDAICDWAAAPTSNERPLQASGLPAAAETLTSSNDVHRPNAKGSR
jgi:hypothetical protein